MGFSLTPSSAASLYYLARSPNFLALARLIWLYFTTFADASKREMGSGDTLLLLQSLILLFCCSFPGDFYCSFFGDLVGDFDSNLIFFRDIVWCPWWFCNNPIVVEMTFLSWSFWIIDKALRLLFPTLFLDWLIYSSTLDASLPTLDIFYYSPLFSCSLSCSLH